MTSTHGDGMEITFVEFSSLGVIIRWSCPDLGFGEVGFLKDDDDNVQCLNECLDRETVGLILQAFLDSCSMRDGEGK